MISLFARDEFAAIGLASLLDAERMPWRRVARLADHDGTLLMVAGADLSAAEARAVAGQRALVLNGGPALAAEVLGASLAPDDGAVAVPLAPPLWPAELRDTAAHFGKGALRLPSAPFVRVRGQVRGRVLASFLAEEEPDALAAVVETNRCVWSALDLGTACARLLTESYAPPVAATAPRLRAAARGAAEAFYYAAPSAVRRGVQRASYRALERRLAALGARASEYPTDATGWLLAELLRALIRRAAGAVLRIERWPAPYASAAVVTHDLEPRRYAYVRGLPRLFATVDDGETRAFGVVARMAPRHLHGAGAASLRGHEVFCHGLCHRGEQVDGRARVLRTVRRARATLERALGRPIAGYRSPRLDRSADLDWALDQAGFAFDSSHPDADRENLRHYGRGVRLNLPYRPPIRERDGRWRASRCLELPLTAPDCIQPLFVGATEASMRASVTEKAAFVRAGGGLYVALVHAGVFGDADAARREAHLAHVLAALRHPETWLATPERVVAWWRGREGLRIEAAGEAVRVYNDGPDPVAGAVLAIERGRDVQRIELSGVPPHGHVSVAAPRLADDGAHAA